MVRKECAPTDQWLGSLDSQEVQRRVEAWLQRIRAKLPEGGTAVATMHKLLRHHFLVSFRASAYGETFISEVRVSEVSEGVEQAGRNLLERLQASPFHPKASLGDKVRRLFQESLAG